MSESVHIALVGCGQLVTLAGPARPRIGRELRELSAIKDGAMLMRDGRIEFVGTRSELEQRIGPKYEVIDAGGRVVLPGFVDAHTHPVFAGTRVDEYEQRADGATYQDIASAGGGIRSTVRRTRAASEDDLFASAMRYSGWFLRTGTTTIEAKSGYGLTLEDESKILRTVRRLNEAGPLRYVPTFLGAHEIPDEYQDRPAEYAEILIHEMLPRVATECLAEYCDVFCEPGIFDLQTARKILSRARSLGFGLRLHADQLSQSGGAQLAAEMRAATADHLERIDDPGIKAMAGAGVQPVLLPGSVYTLGTNRYPPARAMIDAGLSTVLATDFNPGSSPTPSMPMILSLASSQMKMTPAEAISSATINAAYSLGRGNELGSLEPGKRADFVIHDCGDYRDIAYFFGVEPATAVYVEGRLVFKR